MPYAHTTRASIKARLIERLSEAATPVFFTDAEMNTAIPEGVRVLNLLSAAQRARALFNTSTGEPFYNLHAQAETAVLLAPSVTDQDLIVEIQRHLLEPALATAWAADGTDMHTYDEIVTALRRRRTRMLLETGCVLTRDAAVALPSPPQPRLTLSSSILDIRRLVFKDSGNHYSLLQRSSEHDALFTPGWNATAATPYGYSPIAGVPYEIQFLPPPLDTGTLDLISVNDGATLDPANGATALGLPDDLCWGLKYGVLADIFSKDGPGRDPMRAALCERRYRLAVLLAHTMPVILTAEINGRAVRPMPIRSLDLMQPGWQGRRKGTPADMLIAGPNMIAVSPSPNSAGASIALDVVRRAEVPSADDHQIQLPIELIPALIDLCEAYLLLKCGAFEMQLGEELIKRATGHAIYQNARLSTHQSAKLMRDIARLEDDLNPRTGSPDGAGALSSGAIMAGGEEGR